MIYMRSYLFVFMVVPSIFILSIQYSYAQINKGGLPQSFSRAILSNVITMEMPKINVDSLNFIDNQEIDSVQPFRFGYAIDVDMGLNNNGTWDTLEGGDKIWRLKIHSEGAFSINLIYDDFWLPDGAQFFAYNEDQSIVLGAFTSEVSNNEYNVFATDLIKGNTIVLEYYEPAYTYGGRINIDKIIHGYKDVFKSDGLGTSGSCNIDANCSIGNDWCIEKNAVSMILVNDNTALCSGCLINNVRQDLTPYYLTANHCLTGENGNPSTWIFRFKYLKSSCSGIVPSGWVSITGATIKAKNTSTDFLLLELFTKPPSGFGVLYAGWDRASNPPSSAIGIHHPKGDVMKISYDYNSPTSDSYSGTLENTHWKVIWDEGTTEGGSSGSPLFNSEHKIIGQLHGGTASCNNTSGYDKYGKFDVSWYGNGLPSNSLRYWLDPDNTETTSIRPASPTIYLINRTLYGSKMFAALDKIHIEGEVVTGHPFFGNTFCQTSGFEFTTEPNSIIEIKANDIAIKKGTHFKAGSNVRLITTNDIECIDNIVDGDYVNLLCNAQISLILADGSSYNESVNERVVDKNITNFSTFDNSVQENNNVVFENSTIQVIPNPTENSFSIQTKSKDISKAQLKDLKGSIIRNDLTDKLNEQIDISANSSYIDHLIPI
jgi:hypothetical protein